MASERVIFIGASAGGIDALKKLARALPADFPCPLLVVLHIGRHESILPDILAKSGPLSASRARQGDRLRPGHFHVAPPDRHMLVCPEGHIALSAGPKENHARPAIDPMFRSAALGFGRRAIAVVMSGWGEDGTAGLQAVKQFGGCAVVQDPASAQTSQMPESAMRYVAIDHCVAADGMAALLTRMAHEPLEEKPAMEDLSLQHEHQLFLLRGDPKAHLSAIGSPAPYACPDCGGGLWSIALSAPPRFRCHAGHAYTLTSLQGSQAQKTDATLWAAFSGLQEQAMLLRAMAEASLAGGDPAEAARLEVRAAEIDRQAGQLRFTLEQPPPAEGSGADNEGARDAD